jgi:hypothetical protein
LTTTGESGDLLVELTAEVEGGGSQDMAKEHENIFLEVSTSELAVYFCRFLVWLII